MDEVATVPHPSPIAPRIAPRIALVAHRYPPAVGGVERHVAELARGFIARGLDVEVVTTDPTRLLPAHAIEDGVLIHRFPTLADDDVFYVSPRLGAWLALNAGRFSLIHAHSYHTPLAVQALIAARRARLPFVLTPHYHGTGHSALRRALHIPYRLVGGLVVRRSRPLICVSQAERTLLQRHFGDSLETVIVPNGVDVDDIVRARPFDRERGGRLVVTAGRLEGYKQVDRVVAAMAHLPAGDELVVLGTGPARTELERIAHESGGGDRVRVLGHVATEDLRRWLRTADVYVSLSRHEAFGIGLLEGAVAGAGVVASAIPAHREVVGYLPADAVRLVDVDASPSEIAAAIAGASRTEPDPERLAHVPRWSDTVERTLAAYEIALRSPGRGLAARGT